MSEPRSLPPRPSLSQQRKQARELLRAWQADDPDAVERIRAHLPDKPRIGLADAQFVLAREYGFRSWAALKTRIEAARLGAATPDHEAFRAAFDARDLEALRRLLSHPSMQARIDAPMFAFDAPALVHFAGADDLEMVELLLEMGADPNRRSDWWAGGFHALHHARGRVAERLLAAGAEPDVCAAANLARPDLLRRMLEAEPGRVHERGGDGQTPLHFARSREVVDLLLDLGADPDARDVDHRATPAQWMLQRLPGQGRYDLAAYLVERGATADVFLAAALGLPERLRSLLEADPSLATLRTGQGEYGEQAPSSVHIYTWTLGPNLSPLQVAAQFGQEEALAVLRGFALPRERFLAACASADGDEARGMIAGEPGILGELSDADLRVFPDAAWAGNTDAVRLMLDLGFDPRSRSQEGGTALHCAAWQGWTACVELLLRHAPDGLLEDRDRTHGSSPLGWCCHGARFCRNPEGDYPGVARLLLEAGAKPGPNLGDAPDEVLAVIREFAG